MAKDKKSFVLYSDLIGRIEHLTNEEKGLLFQHLLDYINDLKPVLIDRILIGVWIPIEQQLKRDLKKFEQVKVKRSDAGKRSAELRALKKDKQTSTNSTSVKSVEQTSTNPTVSVNDNVNDNVNDILLEKETKDIFNNWLDYRKEIKRPIKSEKTKIALAKKIKEVGFEKSNQVINTSIENGYQGLFWDKIQKTSNQNKTKELTAVEKLQQAMSNIKN